QRAADRALPALLTQRLDVRIARVPEGKDPCDYLTSGGGPAFDQVLEAGVDALEFKWLMVQRRYQEATIGPGRLRAVEEFLDLVTHAADVAAIDAIQRGLLVNQIAKLLGIAPQDVHLRLRKQPPKPEIRGPALPAEPAYVLPAVTDAADAATRELLEVLLNE